jgi:protein-tyrosine phosphatase
MTKILMVCMGNICRSPIACAIANSVAQSAGLSNHLLFDSAGTHANHISQRPDPRAQTALEKHGYTPVVTRSRCVTDHDFQNFDLIVAMDLSNLAVLTCRCPPQHVSKLHLLLEFAPELGEGEVPDPYHGNLAGFERVLNLCEAGVQGLIKAQIYGL